VDQADEHEKQYGADRGLNDGRDDAGTEMNPKLRKYPARNEGAHDPHDEIADEPKARTLDDLAREPAGRDADSQYDEKAFAGYVHLCVPAIGQPGASHHNLRC
jgi:hypothetical protein